jgi:hemerythrin-like metal-binding protein
MSLVTWSDEFCLGMQEIDAQHSVLIDLINQVWVAAVKRPDRAEALRILDELEKYTITHFTAEEIFMHEMNYRNFRAHKEEHAQFVARIVEERARINAGAAVTLDIVHFLKDWLLNHILVSDKEYAQEFKLRSQPASMLGRFFKRMWA